MSMTREGGYQQRPLQVKKDMVSLFPNLLRYTLYNILAALGGGKTGLTILFAAGDRLLSRLLFLGILMLTLIVWPSFKDRSSCSRGSSSSLAISSSRRKDLK